jgi:tetratricopeptide (TPR) repeat protein
MQARERVGGRYELTYPVGQGAMGQVWAGYDEKLDRPVAVKFLRQAGIEPAERATAVERFMREARVTARLEHPGVPAVHDVGFHDADLYIVMQLVTGLLLADLIDERGPFSVPWAAAIGAQICSVLAAAHDASLVHRDLKPQNLIVTPAGAVKVLDFGIAALVGPGDVPRLTATGHTLGTPTYMAPEQALSNTVGPAADLYALGCVLYEMLAGAPPYTADNAVGLVYRHLHDPVPSIADHRAGLPADLADLVTRLLAKDPADRPASAAEVYAVLTPLAATDLGYPGNVVATTPTGQAVDPTMPYRFPFGPIPRTPAPAPTRLDVPVASTLVRQPAPTFDELLAVRDQAAALAEEERFTQAAEALATALRPAVAEHGARHPRILELRLDLANMLLLAGAYRRALPEFVRLVDDLTARLGRDDELVWHCRAQAATCQAELGQASEALRALRELLADQRRVLPADAVEMFPLRQQIAMLTAGVGDVVDARHQLADLLADVRRAFGPDAAEVAEIEALLTHLDRLDDGPDGRVGDRH